jgi:hypothetical protein
MSGKPTLTIAQILAWADAHHQETGKWPTQAAGWVRGARTEKWGSIDDALRLGYRGLPAGSSLARLLLENRNVRYGHLLPPLTIGQVLAWADAHRERTGAWPSQASGEIVDAPGETWLAVSGNLRTGGRGLPGGSSLARLLAAERGARNRSALPRLSIETILRWADAHFRRTGTWPTARSGPIPEAPGERWSAVAAALVSGYRGLGRGSSLRRVLEEHRGIPPRRARQARRDL